MLIPQGQGNTRTLNVSTFHLWTGIACFAVAAFTITYYYQRTQTLQTSLQEAQAHAVAVESTRVPVKPERPQQAQPATSATADQAQYDAALEVLRNELDSVLQLEDQVRSELKMEPRKTAPTGFVSQALGAENGRGGPPISGAALEILAERPTRPHSLIEGIASPSPDMILAELTLRRSSFEDLLEQIRDTIAANGATEKVVADRRVELLTTQANVVEKRGRLRAST